MNLSANVKSAHADLSHFNLKLLDLAERDTRYLERRSFELLDRKSDFIHYPLQSWPFFVSAEAIRDVEASSIGLCELVKSVPERVFGNDPQKLAEFYGLDPAYCGLLVELLKDRSSLEGILSRGDFVNTETGFKCLEFNMSSSLGGWNAAIWAQRYEDIPLIDEFLKDHAIRYCFRDTTHLLFTHLIDEASRKSLADGELNVAFAIPEHNRSAQAVVHYVQQAYGKILKEKTGLERGKVVVCDYGDLTVRNWCLYLGETRVHVLIEDHGGVVDRNVFGALMAGTANVYNGPLTMVVDDKRNLALLSELRDSEDLSARERVLIEERLPWTRRLTAGTTSYGGHRADLFEILVEHQEKMVLKPAREAQGTDVYLGKSVSPATWVEALKKAAASGEAWVAQEFAESLPYYCQSGDRGASLHDVVWGFFVFGQTYAGGFLRMLPKRVGGIVNAAQGAYEGIFWETEEDQAQR